MAPRAVRWGGHPRDEEWSVERGGKGRRTRSIAKPAPSKYFDSTSPSRVALIRQTFSGGRGARPEEEGAVPDEAEAEVEVEVVTAPPRASRRAVRSIRRVRRRKSFSTDRSCTCVTDVTAREGSQTVKYKASTYV